MYRSLIVSSIKNDLFFSSLDLDLFSLLDSPISASELHHKTQYDERNLSLCLDALVAGKFIIKEEDKYYNTSENKKFLSKNSLFYIGDLILQKKKILEPKNLIDRIKFGKLTEEQQEPMLDFKQMAESTDKEMRLFRVKPFLKTAEKLLADIEQARILDLGGGPGIMSIEFVKKHSASSGLIIEKGEVAKIAEKNVIENKLSKRMKVIQGNFLTDNIGSGYDLILASGILAFCGSYLQSTIEKIHKSLNTGGHIIVMTPQLNENGVQPKDIVMCWLSGRINGVEPILKGHIIHNEFISAGFIYTSDYKEPFYCGKIYQKR